MSKKLIATVIATHAGFVNKNYTWYLEEDMANGVDTWTEPFNKPVLVHHEMKSDAIGRVISAKYVKYIMKGKNKPKGYIEVDVEVSDSQAIEKIKDKRYTTVSISTDVGKAYCSICEQDLVTDGLCEHKKGKTYDGKKCFWYMGNLKYKEVSFVNAPADEYAKVISFKEVDTLTSSDATKEKLPMFQFEDEVKDEDCENWDKYTEDDIALAFWLMTEIDNELNEEDKTLTTEQRKKLKTSTFCGPEKSFPIPDCKHVTAARRLIGKYKGPGDKKKIMACVERKAKKMKCDSTKDSIDATAPCIDGMNLNKGDEMEFKDIIVRDDVKNYLNSEIEKTVSDYKTQLEGFKALGEKVKNLETSVISKDEELKTTKELIKVQEDTLINLKGEIHKTYVDRVFDLRKGLGKKDVMSLKDETEIEAYKAELAKRTDESLKDSVKDLSCEVAPEISVLGTIQSTPDSVETNPEGETTPPEKVEDAVEVTRKDKVKNIIFKD